MTYASNHRENITTAAGTFEITQRNSGYAVNDGQWVTRQCADLTYDFQAGGALKRRRHGRVLGVAATREGAVAMIEAAGPMPLVDELVK